MNDELLLLATEWPVEQLDDYIQKLEARIVATRSLIANLKYIRKNKMRKQPVETGSRGGK